jgi:hypothetical protein
LVSHAGTALVARVADKVGLTAGQQPVVELALLLRRRMQLVPDVDGATRGAQASDPQLRAVAVGEPLELIELRDVLPRHDHGELGVLHTSDMQVL